MNIEERMRDSIRRDNLRGIIFRTPLVEATLFGRKRPWWIRDAGLTESQRQVYDQHRIKSKAS